MEREISECGQTDELSNSYLMDVKSPPKLKVEKAKTFPDSYFAGSWGTSLMDIGLDFVKSFLNEPDEEMREYMKATELPLIQCKMCKFKAKSLFTLNYHYEIPHFKRSKYRCNFCSKESVNSQDIMEHMQMVHKVNVHMEKPSKKYQCHNCTFEGTQKGQLRRHLIRCVKKFKLENNLAPSSKFVLPAYIPNCGSKKENNIEPKTRTIENRNKKSKRLSVKEVENKNDCTDHLQVVKRSRIEPLLTNLEEDNQSSDMKDVDLEFKSLKVECEICECFVINMDSLHKHITVTHKVKVSKEKIMKKEPYHPCRKCERSFYTDMGLERHYLGSHGLVTKRLEKSFQDSEDGGYCPLCKNHYDFGLVDHVIEEHKLNLQVLNISYRCEICSETFTLLKKFNIHAQLMHGSN